MTEVLPLTEQQAIRVAAFGIDKPEPLTPVYDFTKTSAEWAAVKGIYVLDASGWDRSTPAAFDASWGRQITESDFDARAASSHTRARPDTDLSAHAGTWRIG